MKRGTFTEGEVEKVTLEWFRNLGYEWISGSDAAPDGKDPQRSGYSDVILDQKLNSALRSINPSIPSHIIDEVRKKVISSRSQDLFENNKIFHNELTNGIEVEYRQENGRITGDKVWLINFEDPEKNHFCVINQFTVKEGDNIRRPDVVVFVNGIPVGVIELKNAADKNATIHQAYNQLQTYKKEIPLLFETNAVLVISDGIEAKVGSLTADKQRFMPWRTLDGISTVPKGTAELKTLVAGLFEPKILLDYIRNFIVYEERDGNVTKIIAGYHQYHAVNRAVERTVQVSKPDGDKRAGVIWHTQGSGKSLSMAFYAGKVIQEKAMENPTLVVLTDRNDLDDQLFTTFCSCRKLLKQSPAQASNRTHLKDLLTVASGGVVFTTVQKFFPPNNNEPFPELSDRRNIVVIADEAHRSQYGFIDGFACHIHDGLPNATFIGFTGTPIELSDRDTYAIFGKSIHTYDIHQAVEDGATVTIYYENRLAKIELNENERPYVEEDFEEVTEAEEVIRQEKLKSKWTRLEALVGTQKRVDLIARDIVNHFTQRTKAQEGKGMIVCMSRRICVALYDAITELMHNWHDDSDDLGFVKVVMTGSAGDPSGFRKHIRNKSQRDALARRFKNPSDPLKLVIVRDMWLTGFDVPCLHTMYVDKPLHGHSLMQAIARVNRVFRDKPGGLIVDYLGITDNLKRALSSYSDRDRSASGVNIADAIFKMHEKYDLVQQMFHGFDYSHAIVRTTPCGCSLSTIRLETIVAAMDHVLSQERGRERFMKAVLDLSKAFALCATSDEAKSIRDEVGFFQEVRSALFKSTTGSKYDFEDLDTVVKQLVSRAIVSTEIVDIYAAAGLNNPNISLLSPEFLCEIKSMRHENLAREILKKLIKDEVKARSKKNIVQSRKFTEMLEDTIRRYRNRQITTVQVIEELTELAKEMQEAQNRGEQLGLSADESAFYDALSDNLSAKEILGDDLLGIIAKELVSEIKKKVTIDWAVKASVRAEIRLTIKRVLRKHKYPPDKQKKATTTVLEQAELFSTNWATV